jgi:hypothetical protein
MRSAPAILGLIAGFLGIVWTAVFALGDTGILVSPPEAVAEQFLRSLQTRRYEQARALLASEARTQITGDDLRRLHRDLESRVGKIENVQGQKSDAPNEAYCLLETRRGQVRVALPFERANGDWHIRDVAALQAVSNPTTSR